MEREAEMKREAAMKELAEGMCKLFPGLVFVPVEDGLRADADGLIGKVDAWGPGHPFTLEISVDGMWLVSRRCKSFDGVKADHARLLALHRRLGLLLGVSDG